MLNVLSNQDSWAIVSFVSIVAIVCALVAHAVMFAALRRLGRYSVMAATVAEYTHEAARTALPVMALQLVFAVAPAGLPYENFVRKSVALLAIGALTWLAACAIRGIAEGIIRAHPANAIDNLDARRVQTQTRVLARTVIFFVVLLGSACALMLFPSVRQIGTTLLASAGLAGLVAGIAARPVLASLIAGLQIALTQPIRIDDVVIVNGEWGRIEEMTTTYVVVKVWDERRLIVPLQWMIENPFQNWTRTESQLIGTVFIWVDFATPLAPLRAELERVCRGAPEWDQRVALLQVVETNERAMQLRALVSSGDASKSWDLRCRVREALIDFLQCNHPQSLPRVRAMVDHNGASTPEPAAGTSDDMGIGESSAIKLPTQPQPRPAGDAREPSEVQNAPVNQTS